MGLIIDYSRNTHTNTHIHTLTNAHIHAHTCARDCTCV